MVTLLFTFVWLYFKSWHKRNKIFGIMEPLPWKKDKNKLCRHTMNPPPPHVDKHEHFSNPPSPLTCYIVYGWPLTQNDNAKVGKTVICDDTFWLLFLKVQVILKWSQCIYLIVGTVNLPSLGWLHFFPMSLNRQTILCIVSDLKKCILWNIFVLLTYSE